MSVRSAGPTLKSVSAKPIATAKEKKSVQRPISAGSSSPSAVLLRRVVGGDRERAEADRERLAERDDAADDRQPQRPVARHQRIDRAPDVRDLAVGLADGDGPVARAAHHDALEDGLAADRLRHG